MPEDNVVRGIPNRPDLPGPPRDPNPRALVTDEDTRIGPIGNPDATSRRYFLETKSTNLSDIITRTSEDDPVPSVDG